MSSIDKFVNPYNFVPFANQINEKRTGREKTYRATEKLFSGWMDLRIDLKTPLIIPDGAYPEYDKMVAEHKKYHFMKLPNEEGMEEYAIPGSEIRGMIRSVYETATDSCLPLLLDDKKISQRVPTFSALRRRGLLEYNKERKQWILYATEATAESVSFKKNNQDEMVLISIKNQAEIKVLPGDLVKDKGVVQYNIPVVTKKNYSIRYLNPTKRVYTWDPVEDAKKSPAYLDLATELDITNNKKKHPNAKCQRAEIDCLKRAAEIGGKENMVPVFYFMVDNDRLVYMSCSSAGRITQRRKWKEIMGDYAPCDSVEKLCPACLLFGTIKDKGMKGHVRFTDARPIKGEALQKEETTLQILATPRPSAFEFYLRRPEKALYWNFDFYSVKTFQGGKPTVDFRHLEPATPRGRKMYWHGPVVAGNESKSKMNTTMEAITEGTFHSRVYFDQITDQQLTDLAWVITLSENEADSTKQHKLGHAKPLGYGSVKMIIEHCMIREITNDKGKLSAEVKEKKIELDKASFDFNSPTIQSLLKMCDAGSIKEKISYPCSSDGKEPIYEWFTQNRKNAGKLVALPEPLDEDVSLETLKAQGKKAVKNSTSDEVKNKSFKEGTIIDHNRSGKFAYAKLTDGGKASFWDNGKYPEGTKVLLEYEGKDERGYDFWKLVKVLK